MKKSGLIMIIITLVFCGFAGGFFLGRSLNSGSIQVSAVPTDPAPTDVQTATVTTGKETVTFPLNINTASAEELAELPGIGEKIAQAIIDYRTTNGPYTSLSDLLKVENIGQKRLEAILSYITIGG